MSIQHPSRRQFLTAASLIATWGLTAEAGIGRRRRCIRPLPARFPPQPASAPPLQVRQDILRVRPDISSLTEQQLASLKNGVAAMKALPASDPRSWWFQANIHGTQDPSTNPLFNQCEHGTLLFLAWHRGYLYYFERILRQVTGDTNLNLPYWDWTAAPMLPVPFRTPDDPSNPLYDDSRTVNDGSALPPEIVEDDLNAALDFVEFPARGATGFSFSLEDSPHGQVHVLVGGTMSRIQTAANDPIFWLHHCNIDRLWNRWLNRRDGRVNPSAGAFLDQAYTFVDENGSNVSLRVRDILWSAQLGYRYDNVPNPAPAAPIAVAMLPAPTAYAADEEPKKVRAASTVKEDQPSPAESKPLGFKPERVKLHVAAAHAATLKSVAGGARPDRPGKILVQIEGLSLAEVPNFAYAVYLNLPEGEIPAEQAKEHYVGSINFFGKGGHDVKQPHGRGADKTFTATFDVTAAVARLQQRGRWKPDDLSITLRPLTPIPPKGSEERLRKRSEESAKKAKLSYKRINLLVVPQ